MFWFEWATPESSLNSETIARIECATNEESNTQANIIYSETFKIKVSDDGCFSYVELNEDLEGLLKA